MDVRKERTHFFERVEFKKQQTASMAGMFELMYMVSGRDVNLFEFDLAFQNITVIDLLQDTR